jgi:hypothetical protein
VAAVAYVTAVVESLMSYRTAARLAATLAATVIVVLLAASPAAATTGSTFQVPLNPGQKNSTATDFEHSCSQIPGGKPIAGKDGWVFVLPASGPDSAKFVKLTLKFKSGSGDVMFDVPVNGVVGASLGVSGDIITDANGTSKAWVLVPAGWVLVDGTAEVSGYSNVTKFNVTHTCVAVESTPTKTPTPCPSKSTHSPKPTPSKSESTSESPSPSVSPSSSISPSVSPTPTTGGGGTTLPTTGANVAMLVGTGVALVTAGAGLLLAWRRRTVAITS